MKSLKNYIMTQLGVGRNFFTKNEVLNTLGITPNQFKFQAYRLTQKKAIKRLANNFYMIIPPEYYHLGSLPPLWLIDSLMKYLKQEYYVGLLTAGSIYGATEQQPMVFQVITNKRTRNIRLKRGLIEFHNFSGCKSAIKKSITVPTGYVQISSKEQTMLDLIRFYKASGYLDNVALVIKSLAEECNPHDLESIVKREKINPILQRLGYILEYVGYPKLAAIVGKELKKRTTKYVLLKPDFRSKQRKRVTPWKLIINDNLELE